MGRTRSRRFATFAWVTAAAALTISCFAKEPEVPEEPGLWNQVVGFYEKAKEAGETVPDDVVEWVKEDVGRIGTWEYRVLSSEVDDDLEVRLDELGGDRWECFAVVPAEKGVRLYLKRPVRSYLRHIPVGDLLKLVPVGGGGEGGE